MPDPEQLAAAEEGAGGNAQLMAALQAPSTARVKQEPGRPKQGQQGQGSDAPWQRGKAGGRTPRAAAAPAPPPLPAGPAVEAAIDLTGLDSEDENEGCILTCSRKGSKRPRLSLADGATAAAAGAAAAGAGVAAKPKAHRAAGEVSSWGVRLTSLRGMLLRLRVYAWAGAGSVLLL